MHRKLRLRRYVRFVAPTMVSVSAIFVAHALPLPGLSSEMPREQRGVEDLERFALAGRCPWPLFGHENVEVVG
jgi:hypothetical protein